MTYICAAAGRGSRNNVRGGTPTHAFGAAEPRVTILKLSERLKPPIYAVSLQSGFHLANQFLAAGGDRAVVHGSPEFERLGQQVKLATEMSILPRSNAPIWAQWNPLLSANTSCVQPRLSRSVLILAPIALESPAIAPTEVWRYAM
jgi:hypothetical protein